MSEQPIINVDLDGVIYDFNKALASWLESQGRYGPGPIKSYDLSDTYLQGMSYPTPIVWDYWSQWDMTKGQWLTEFRRGVEAGFIWVEGRPMKGAVHGMWELNDAGFYLRIVTHRLVHKSGHRQAISSTVDWLDKYNIPYRSIAFLGKEGKDNYEAEILVDDKPENVEDWTRFHRHGILYDQPWNRSVEASPERRIYRATSWDSVVSLAKSLEV